MVFPPGCWLGFSKLQGFFCHGVGSDHTSSFSQWLWSHIALDHRRVSDIKPSAIHHSIHSSFFPASNSKLELFTLQFTPHFWRLWLDPNLLVWHLSCLYLPSAVAPLQFVITAPAISLLSLSPGSHSEAPGVQFLSVHMYTGPRWYILAKLVWLWLLPSWVMFPLIWGMLRKPRENYFRYCNKTTLE